MRASFKNKYLNRTGLTKVIQNYIKTKFIRLKVHFFKKSKFFINYYDIE
jgi:hypothetical protein